MWSGFVRLQTDVQVSLRYESGIGIAVELMVWMQDEMRCMWVANCSCPMHRRSKTGKWQVT